MMELVVGSAVAVVVPGLAWAISVERRLSRTDALVEKLDELVTLLLEEKRGGTRQDKERRQAEKSSHPRGNS